MRLLSIALVSLLLGSTAWAGTWEDDDKAIAACFEAMDRSPELAVVNAKFARRKPTTAQLADRSLRNRSRGRRFAAANSEDAPVP